jgi:hypothetical protein
MNARQIEAEASGVKLSPDVADGGGYTKYTNLNRTDKVCPRCHQKTVDKFNRRCKSCSGRLHWAGDDCRRSDEEFSWWYMWIKPAGGGIEGWYDKSYFKDAVIAKY